MFCMLEFSVRLRVGRVCFFCCETRSRWIAAALRIRQAGRRQPGGCIYGLDKVWQ